MVLLRGKHNPNYTADNRHLWMDAEDLEPAPALSAKGQKE